MKLIIYDMSAIINAGTKASHSKMYNINGIPTGGLYKLFFYLIQDMLDSKKEKEKDGQETKIIACFDTTLANNIRKEVLPVYKSNRGLGSLNNCTSLEEYEKLSSSDREKIALARNVFIQTKFCEDCLGKLGVLTVKADGYEADDLIYSSVISTMNEQPKVVIRADDEDLYDCLAYNPKVEFFSVAGRGKLSAHTGVIFNKILHGCTSDKIPSTKRLYPRESLLLERALLDGVINPFNIHNADGSLNKNLLDELNLPDVAKKGILENMYCVVPFIADLSKFIEEHNTAIDEDYLYLILSSFRMKTLARKIGKTLPDKFSDESKKMLNEIQKLVPPYVLKYFGSKVYNV